MSESSDNNRTCRFWRMGIVVFFLISVSGCQFDWLPLKEQAPAETVSPTVSSGEYYYRLGLKHTADSQHQDLVAARQAFRQAADKDHANAQYLLALSYFNGKGGRVSYSSGLFWLEKAAANGQPEAQFRLGDIYLNGRDVDAEEAWGIHWLARAADQGHVESQYQLGIAYAAGLGWPRDLPAAWAWLSLAKRAGDESAADLLRRLQPRLSASQLAEGKQLLSGWRQVQKESSVPRGQVRFIQHALNRLGYDSGNADGWIGPVTRQAIGQFRQAKGLAGNTAAVNTALVNALRDALIEHPAASPASAAGDG